jgi:phosphoglycerate kinase
MRTLDDLDVSGRRVLLRADLNVPLTGDADGAGVRVADDTRIRAALPTIAHLRARGARIVLVSHLGRPHAREPGLSMRPVAERLRELSGAPLTLAPGVVGPEVQALAEGLAPGAILLLENVRYEPGETKNDPALAAALAALADVYVDDAFGSAHRAHASTEGVAHLLPPAAGLLMEREVRTLTDILHRPARPLLAVLGGAKVHDKLALLERFLTLADRVLIGGAMAFPLLAAQGHTVGSSLCPPDDIAAARHILARGTPRTAHDTPPGMARAWRAPELPEDLVIATALSAEAARRELRGVEVPAGWMGLDIGPRTAARYADAIATAGTVFWNGPMGAFECEPFAAGTHAVARAVAEMPGVSVVGGGETVEALRQLGLQDRVTHLSTGGGATLELLEGLTLPGVAVLES